MKATKSLHAPLWALLAGTMTFAGQLQAQNEHFSIGHSFSPGDVLSADILNQAFGRIERGINLPHESDVIGTWNCTSRRQKTSTTAPADGGGWTTPGDTNGLYQVGNQSVTFSSDTTTSFSFTSTAPNLFHPTDSATTATGKYSLFGPQLFIRSDTDNTVALASLKMLGSNNIFLITESGSERVASSCNRTSFPPNRPTSLSSSLSGSTVNLTWVDNSSDETGFRVYRRQVSTFQGRGARARALVANGGVSSVTIRRGGYGYSTAPSVELVGGGGTGATATAQLTNGQVSGVTVSSAGSGYTHAPKVVFRTANDFQLITSTSADTTTYADGPSTGKYIYTVVAVNSTGQSPSSNVVVVDVP